jgi:hypothetical protein
MRIFSETTSPDNTWLPVGIALIVSLLLHIPVMSKAMYVLRLREVRLHQPIEEMPEEHEKTDQNEEEKDKQDQAEDDHLLLGKDDAAEVLTLNWIGYEDFEKLIAMPSENEQAALQRLADPVKIAETEVDPATDVLVTQKTTPRPQATPQQATPKQVPQESEPVEPMQPQKPVESVTQLPQPQAVAQSSPIQKPSEQLPVPVPVIMPEMEIPDQVAHEQPITSPTPSVAMVPQTTTPSEPIPAIKPEAPLPERVEPTPEVKQQEQTKPTPAQHQQQQESVAQPYNADQIADKPRLTVMPRDDKESPPFSLDHHEIEGKIGGVIVGKGIEIQTRVPRFSAVTQASIWPKANPVVEITFATDGVVITAEIIKSSGYAGIDSPILTSVYHWKAKGKLLKELGRPFKRKFTFRLFDEEIN